MAVEQCMYRIGEPNILCNQPIFANIHDPVEQCGYAIDGLPCPAGNHHNYVRPDTHEVNIIRVENLLRGADIVWPKYGTMTVEQLAERIVTLLES